MKIHLIDGTYELFRAHFGAPPARGLEGRPVGAARGLLRSLQSLLREDDCTHLAIAFDHVIESFRNQLFHGYKTGDGIEPDLLQQFSLAEEVAAALGIVVWPMVEFEADDALATAAMRWWDQDGVDQVVICSPDKDLAQCVQGDRVVLWDRMRKRVINEEAVIEKWGIAPTSMPDYLALVGDSADGIPGIPKWGAKSTSTLLATYGQLVDIPPDADDWEVKVRGAKGLAETLREGKAEAELYRTLATLRRDVPLAESLADLQWQGPQAEALDSIYERLGLERES